MNARERWFRDTESSSRQVRLFAELIDAIRDSTRRIPERSESDDEYTDPIYDNVSFMDEHKRWKGPQ